MRKEEERKRKEQEKQSREETKKQSGQKTRPAQPESVVKVMVCTSCGEENKMTAKFCDNCGKKMRP